MNENLEKILVERYPKIFDNTNSQQPFPMFGIECGNGWFDLLDSLCFEIQGRIDHSTRQHDIDVRYNLMLEHLRDGNYDLFEEWTRGWTPTQVSQFQEKLDLSKERPVSDVIPQVVVEQIKEKFGTLRFYYRGGNHIVDVLVNFAEHLSGKICETCGKPGSFRGRSYFYTACDDHTKLIDRFDSNNDNKSI